jgi:hypothetical protein
MSRSARAGDLKPGLELGLAVGLDRAAENIDCSLQLEKKIQKKKKKKEEKRKKIIMMCCQGSCFLTCPMSSAATHRPYHAVAT